MPINEEVRLNEGPDFAYLEKLQVENALVLRQADEATDFYAAYQKVKDYALEYDLPLEDTF